MHKPSTFIVIIKKNVKFLKVDFNKQKFQAYLTFKIKKLFKNCILIH